MGNVLMRSSLRQASAGGEELKMRARSSDVKSNQRALAKLKDIAQATECPGIDFQVNWDRGHARYWLRSTGESEEAFAYDEGQLPIADALGAAEFQVFRAFDLGIADLRVFYALLAADAKIAGWRQGRQLEVVTFLLSAAKFRGAKFEGTCSTPRGRGLFYGPTESRYFRAFRD